jgi:secreted trypsin-like serine protease
MKLLLISLALFLETHAIYYGNTPDSHQFPYTVLIQASGTFCSGAIITDKHVVTSAHCLMSTKKVTVHVGAHHFEDDESDGEKFISEKFWIHEDFEMPSAVYDIGLIQLPEPLDFSHKVDQIAISIDSNVERSLKNKGVTVAGWGYTEESEDIADTLQYAEMNLISLKECMKFKKHYIEDLDEDNICMTRKKGMPCE